MALFRIYFFQAFPMRNTLVPQDGHSPCVAGRPFFIVIDLAFFISTFFRHFTQYACIFTSSLVSVQLKITHCQAQVKAFYDNLNNKTQFSQVKEVGGIGRGYVRYPGLAYPLYLCRRQ